MNLAVGIELIPTLRGTLNVSFKAEFGEPPAKEDPTSIVKLLQFVVLHKLKIVLNFIFNSKNKPTLPSHFSFPNFAS